MNKTLQSLRVTLLNIAHVQLDNRWDYDNIISPFSRMYYIKSGNARVYHHDQVFELVPGYLYLIPSFTYSHYKCDGEMEQIYVHFLEEVGTGLSIYDLENFVYQIPASMISQLLIDRLLELNPDRGLQREDPKVYDNNSSLNSFMAKNNNLLSSQYIETHGILQMLLGQFIDDTITTANPVRSKGGKIPEVLEYINMHLQDGLTVEHLAERCHINPDYFSRLFKEHTGIRPLQYIQNKRIERARLLLLTTSHSMQKIADMVGLHNISYFNRLFLKLTQKTPLAYRKELWSI
jgi:AraC-like DNA-binding protein